MRAGTSGLLARLERWDEREALAADTRSYTYRQLGRASRDLALALLDGGLDLGEDRVVLLAPPGGPFVAWLLAAWRAGGMAVPLSGSQSPAEWDHIVADAEAAVVVGPSDAAPELYQIAERHGARFLDTDELGGEALAATGPEPTADPDDPRWQLPAIATARGAMILYTSGTTSGPKGVVLTHANLAAQISTLVEAWAWTERDRILNVLPLNHVHGLVNVLGCALWSGAVCEMLSPFDAASVWERFASGRLSLFMAVPTVYARLASAFDLADAGTRTRWADGARRLRLMVSGSAALPATLLDRWRAMTGHVLLERYGMTETGMALSNPLDGARRPGLVGTPLPGVDVRLVDEQGRAVPGGTPGEIEVQGPSVFREYWRRPDATAAAFRNGWFRTGDVAVVEEGSYRILGRTSVDIIKTGGYKVSALEIEEVLREHPAIAECAVVGVPDEEWGERVAAAVVLRREPSSDTCRELASGESLEPAGPRALTLDALRAWASSRLATYKLPTRLASVDALPRNAMGKVVKAEVRKLFDST